MPEVELVARALDRLVAGRRIVSAKLLRPGLAPETPPARFARQLRGCAIKGVTRRGKHVIFELDARLVLVTHLRMTGRFLLLPPPAPPPKHTHALFRLDDARRLAFADQRHFGMMKLLRAEELTTARELRSLAPEPFSEEFSPDYLRAAFTRTRRTLKETLLDQTKVTGLGNIYAAEAMFLARVSPFVSAASLSPRRLPRLHRAILEVLGEAIRHGSTMNVNPEDFESGYYGGPYEGRWRVYAREGEPCTVCRTPVRRVAHAGRSTFYCPRCQRR
ncbi:MAG TPA: bifunctional DNA-formamidopyrimidine glycosylase/DNA-(apurinic or apyrimidinic site) lyase [Pyrinomonadaceae bacterium]|nr:bifunctional DNA-formamidopyrimidine glycosylase/DNA-(apurinic or apyrimidinic site) lyase [Pyrinomonadaceae bacterium]